MIEVWASLLQWKCHLLEFFEVMKWSLKMNVVKVILVSSLFLLSSVGWSQSLDKSNADLAKDIVMLEAQINGIKMALADSPCTKRTGSFPADRVLKLPLPSVGFLMVSVMNKGNDNNSGGVYLVSKRNGQREIKTISQSVQGVQYDIKAVGNEVLVTAGESSMRYNVMECRGA